MKAYLEVIAEGEYTEGPPFVIVEDLDHLAEQVTRLEKIARDNALDEAVIDYPGLTWAENEHAGNWPGWDMRNPRLHVQVFASAGRCFWFVSAHPDHYDYDCTAHAYLDQEKEKIDAARAASKDVVLMDDPDVLEEHGVTL